MGLVFHFIKKMPESPNGNVRGLFETAPSFFTARNIGVRQDCHGYGHGIIYEGQWVTYKGITMKGHSKLDLDDGVEFELLCKNDVFVSWFKKVLNGEYMGYDFDKLSFEVLKSLTSPNTPGSLASMNPAGLKPSTGIATQDSSIMVVRRKRPNTNTSILGQPATKRAQTNNLPLQNDSVISTAEEANSTPEATQRAGLKAPDVPASVPPTGTPQNQATYPNPGRQPLLSDKDLGGYIHLGTMAQLRFAWDESISQGSVQFYDQSVTDIVLTWAQNRQALVQNLMRPPSSGPIASVTLATALSNDDSPTSVNPGCQDKRDLANHMHMHIMMQSIFAWDESVRRKSPDFYDRSQRHIMDTWTQKRKLLLQVLSGGSSA
jgi:hypothetical protein